MNFLAITTIGLLMIISPGPDFAIVVKNSLAYGRKSGIKTSLGIGLGNFCHVVINIIGIGIILSHSILAFTILKVLGALYLLFLGGQNIKNSFKCTNDSNPGETKQLIAGFLSGFYCGLLNPKAFLFYCSLFAVMLPSSLSQSTKFLYGGWLATIAVTWFIIVAYFFTLPSLYSALNSAKKWIERIAGGMLVFFGSKLFFLKLSL